MQEQSGRKKYETADITYRGNVFDVGVKAILILRFGAIVLRKGMIMQNDVKRRLFGEKKRETDQIIQICYFNEDF